MPCSKRLQEGQTARQDAEVLQLKPDMILYGAIMNGCGSATFQVHPADQGEKAHQCLALSSWGDRLRWQLAIEVFAEAEQLPLSLMAVCTAMAALGRGSCWSEALDMLDSLPRRQLQPRGCRNRAPAHIQGPTSMSTMRP